MKKITVNLQGKSYPIVISSGLFSNPGSFWPLAPGDTVVIITNDFIPPVYSNIINSTLNKLGVSTDILMLPDGEKNKSLLMLDVIFTKLLKQNYDRNTVLIALGGGVIGDLTGFAAATYQRGIRFMQVPTTLLAQVDASIGGKTSVNHILGKNMIGAFYQPISVIIDLDVLFTLTAKEFSFGLSEVIKYAVALDESFFVWLENNLDDVLMLKVESLMYCVYWCCKLKASIVEMDEYDKGTRNLLNLGHTYGHAIESYFQYNAWSHGESISVGIIMAVDTAVRLGKFSNFNDVQRIKRLLKRANLPIYSPKEMYPESYMKYIRRDKKSRLGGINLVLPISIGHSKFFVNIEDNVILNVIKDSYKK